MLRAGFATGSPRLRVRGGRLLVVGALAGRRRGSAPSARRSYRRSPRACACASRRRTPAPRCRCRRAGRGSSSRACRRSARARGRSAPGRGRRSPSTMVPAPNAISTMLAATPPYLKTLLMTPPRSGIPRPGCSPPRGRGPSARSTPEGPGKPAVRCGSARGRSRSGPAPRACSRPRLLLDVRAVRLHGARARGRAARRSRRWCARARSAAGPRARGRRARRAARRARAARRPAERRASG